MSYQLSIIIPVFNKYNFTKSALNDLFKLPSDTHQIIVVDNGSSDETQTELSKIKRDNFVYIRSEKNGGFAFACNRGYVEAAAPNVLFLNNDIRVNADHTTWTKPLLEHCQTALVGPTMGQLDTHFNFVREANIQLTGGHPYMSGWCLAGSKQLFDRLKEKGYQGPFSEDFFCYFEDTFLGLAAARLGIPCKVVSIPVVHFGKTSSKQLNVSKLYSDSRRIFLGKLKELPTKSKT